MKAIDLKEGELLMRRGMGNLFLFLRFIQVSSVINILLTIIEYFLPQTLIPILYPLNMYLEYDIPIFLVIFLTSICLTISSEYLEEYKEFEDDVNVYYFIEYLLIDKPLTTTYHASMKIRFDEFESFRYDGKWLHFFINKALHESDSEKYEKFNGYRFRLSKLHKNHAAELVGFLNSKIIRNNNNDNV